MLRILSHGLWAELKTASLRAPQRKAAVAYVTKDLVGFRRGDVLVTDASEGAIRSGETDAKLLLRLHRKGVRIYRCPRLHAKVLLLGDVAVIGSGNLSVSSEKALVEAAVLTDHKPAVSGVASLITQLVHQSERLDTPTLETLTKIKVVPKGGAPAFSASPKPKISPLGSRTWLIGVWELVETDEAKEKWVDGQSKEAAKKHGCTEDEIEWIEWGKRGRLVREAQPGDRVIQIWRDTQKDEQPTVVLKATPLLLKRVRKGVTYLFTEKAQGKKAAVPWPAFQKLLKKLGAKPASKDSERLLSEELADAIDANWDSLPSGK
jgi:hypothetical protein